MNRGVAPVRRFLVSIVSSLLILTSNQAKAAEVKAVVFDMGGVVMAVDKERLINYGSQALNLSPLEFLAVLNRMTEHVNQGGDEQEFWCSYANERGMAVPENCFADLSKVFEGSFKKIPGSLELIEELKAQGYSVVAFSNVNPIAAAVTRGQGYYDPFDTVILSCDIGVQKPNERAYKTLLERLNLSPDCLVFIDDELENTLGARRVGIDSILFTSVEELRTELRNRGIHLL